MRFSDDTTEVRHWTPPEAILAVLRVLHKNPSSFDLGSKMGPGGLLFEEALFQWGEAWLLFVIFPIFMLHFWQICLCCLTQRFSILPWKTRHKLPRTMVLELCPPQQIKRLSRKFDWDFVWPLNWLERARAWLSANTASNGELESRGSIDLPVTFTRLA